MSQRGSPGDQESLLKNCLTISLFCMDFLAEIKVSQTKFIVCSIF
ncbi:hypothetical protein RRSWK_01072 [Rhodopirellula sp. SWK7]|nr:hypothetical protein RRSWK_01072 [Rhodopirellula sp. SWK7]